MSTTDNNVVQLIEDDNDDQDDPEEYTVEDIRAKRRNPKTNGIEYLIKWENFPESDNTWEPSEHMKCPEIVQRFEEREKNKRRRRKAERLAATWNNKSDSPAKRTKLDNDQPGCSSSTSKYANDEREVFLENDDDDENIPTRPTTSQQKQQQDVQSEQIRLKGFDRGLPLDCILAASLDEFGKLWFLVKWEERNDVELVGGDEMEAKAPRELCRWYRERLYWSIDDPSVSKQGDVEKQSQQQQQ